MDVYRGGLQWTQAKLGFYLKTGVIPNIVGPFILFLDIS